MIAHFNYTDRIDLKAKMFEIAVKEGPPRTFEIKWNFEGIVLPADAKVYVEAMVSGSPVVMRFPLGTVATPELPASGTALTDLPGENVRFAVKIVDETADPAGRIVGLCENIRPKMPGEGGECGTTSILPVEPVEMGERVWRLKFAQKWVFLQVNKNIPDILFIAQNDPKFFAFVFPEVIRQILDRALVIEGHREVTNNDEDWKDQWLRYAITWHPDQEPPPEDLNDPLDEDGRQQLEAWIEDAVNSFCKKKGTAFLVTSADEEGQQ